MFSNIERTQDIKKSMDAFSGIHTKREFGVVGLGTTKIDEGDRLEEDLAAIPDLVAGALSEVATQIAQFSGGRIPIHIAVALTNKFTPKTDIISSWLWDRESRFQKVVMIIDKHGRSGFSTCRLDMSE